MSQMSVEELRKDLWMVNSPEFEKDRPWLKAKMERILRDKLDQQQELENRESRRLAQQALDAAQRGNKSNQVFWIISIAIGLAALIVALLALLK